MATPSSGPSAVPPHSACPNADGGHLPGTLFTPQEAQHDLNVIHPDDLRRFLPATFFLTFYEIVKFVCDL